MHAIFLFFLFAFFSNTALAADDNYGIAEDEMLSDSLTILAVSSLAAPVSELALNYSKQNNVDVNVVYESSAELIRQIDEGEPADIVIFSGTSWVRDIKNRGLIDPKSITKLSQNALAFVSAKNVSVPQNLLLPEALDYIQARVLMVASDPAETSLGIATKSVLEKTNRAEKFEKMLVLAPNSYKTTDLIIKSQTAGIIYLSDYFLYSEKLNLVTEVPAQLHEPLIYQGAVVVGKKMDDARKLLNFLSSKPAKEKFKKYGFIVD